MQNQESVAQKMSELWWHLVCKRMDILSLSLIQSKLQFVKLFEVWTKSVLVEGKGVSQIWKMAANYMNVFQVEHKNIVTQN